MILGVMYHNGTKTALKKLTLQILLKLYKILAFLHVYQV